MSLQMYLMRNFETPKSSLVKYWRNALNFLLPIPAIYNSIFKLIQHKT